MQDWLPYLHELLGEDENGREQTRTLLTLSRVLGDDRLQVRDRVRLLDSLSRLDSVQQVFLLPWLLDMSGDPSRVVRQRLLVLLDDLLGHTQTPFLAQLGKLADRDAFKKTLPGLLVNLSEMLRSEEVDPEAPFSALLFLRAPAFGLATLLSLNQWVQQARPQETDDKIKAFFSEEEQTPLREQLRRWLSSGPLFLRYLIVRWLGRSGVALDSEIDPAPMLYDRYLDDPDPLVAGAAIEAFARRVEPKSLHRAVYFISKECSTFRIRPLKWQGLPIDEAVRAVSLSQMRALGYLAQKHYPDVKALAALRRLVKAWPQTRLNLGDSKLPPEERKKVFCASLLLWGTRLRVRLKPETTKGKLFGLPGFRPRVQIEDPREVLKKYPDCETVWAAALRRDQFPEDPLKWRYEILEPMRPGKVSGAYDLLGMTSPALSRFLTVEKRPYEFSVELRSRLEQEIDRRGWWMLEACDLVARLVVVGLEHGDALDSDPLRDFFSYLADLAIAANICRFGQDGSPRQLLKARMRSIFLNRFARQEAFDLLFPNREAEPLEAQLLTELASAALRSLPEDPANAWIARNHGVLRSITLRDDWHERLRGNAMAALQFHGARYAARKDVSGLEPIERDLLPLPGRRIYQHCPQALAFISDEDLEALRRDELRMDSLELLADPHKLAQPRQGRIVLLWSELLARSLERDDPGCDDAQRGAGVCLGALGALMPLRTVIRLRLLHALASCSVPLTGNPQRLLDHLLRTSSSSELQLYLDMTWNRQGSEFWRQLVTLLVQEDQDIVLGGQRQFDIHSIADRLARRRVILRALSARLRDQPGFYELFRRLRTERLLPRETDRVVPARGEVLPVEARPDQPVEHLSVLRPLVDPGRAAVAEMGGDLLPSFVHHPQARTPLHCLMHLHPASPGLIDFHGLPVSTEQKRSILEQQFATEEQVRVLARVESDEGGGEYRVDLGVGIPKVLHRNPVLSFDRSLELHGTAVVEIRRQTGKKRVLTEVKLRPWLGGEAGVHAVDLRGEPGALDRLETLWDNRQDFKLRATVKRIIPQESGTMLCLLGTGFLWHGEDGPRLPAVFLKEDLPEVGEEMLVDRPAFLKFETIEVADLSTLHLEAVRERSVPEGWIVAGTLHSKRQPRSGRRRWRGRIGHLELPVERRKLSGDLHKLFALDEANEDTQLRSLGTEQTLFKVVDQKLSVVDAPPAWRGFDLVLAVQAGQVGWMTLLEQTDSRQMLFEIGGFGDKSSEPDSDTTSSTAAPLPAFGVLASLDEGELFDEAGNPVGERLRPGEKIPLKVTLGRLSSAGRLLPSPGDGAGSLDVPYLQMADEIDDSALSFRDAYPRNSVVRVQLSGSGQELELLDPEPGFPPPLVVPDPREREGFRGVPGALDAMILSDWQPEAEGYKLTVGRVRERHLHLHPRPESQKRDFLRYLRLEVGTALRDRKHFIAEAEQRLACFVGGLKVSLDPQVAYLLPEPLTAEKLNEARLSAPVRVTAMRSVHRPLKVPSDLTPIPYLEQHQLALGLVVSTSVPDSGSKQVAVLWTASDPGERPDRLEISKRWAFEPPVTLYNGDVLRATVRKNAQIELVRVHRYLTGTILHRAESCTTWASSLPGTRTRGLVAMLLRRPESLEESWLFAFAPATLVEVEPEQLHLVQRLDEAWSLDRVRFDLRWEPGTASKVRLEVRDFRPGPLRSAVGERLTLEVQWRNWKTGRFSCVLRGSGEMKKLGGLPLELGPNELPPHQSPKLLTQQLQSGGRQKIPVTCTLAGYRLEVRQELDEDDSQPRIAYEFDLRPQLGTHTPQRRQPQPRAQKRPLDEALAATGRLDNAAGRVIEVEEGLAVRLGSYEHLEHLPLPEAEITWILYTGDVVAAGFLGTFTVFCDAERRPAASLRRKPPLTLSEWLRKKRLADTRAIIGDHRLLFFGELKDEHLRECGLPELTNEEGASPDPLVLFESEPGVSLVAHSHELLFQSRPFDSKTLRYGDAVLSFQLREPSAPEDDEEASGKILDILKVEIDVARQVEDFAKTQHGLHYGRVQLDGDRAELKELRGADYRPRPIGRQRLARWQLQLEEPDDEQLKWLAELGEDEFVYLQLVRVDRQAGALVFRLATSEQVFAEQNLVFVRAQRIEPYGDSRMLRVEPLSAGFAGEYLIPDNLFSERRGRLEGSRRTLGGIFVARVYRQEVYRDQPSVKLSLIHTPQRRFGYLMSEERWQAIVKHVHPQKLAVEIGEGVNAEIPRNRIRGVEEIWEELQLGDVLMLRRLERQHRVELVDRVCSHMAYLDIKAQRTVLTELWGSPKRRQQQFERDGVLNCNLIGLSQLRGVSKLSEDSVGTDHPLPQVVREYKGGWIRLEEGVGADAFAGRLHFDEKGLPQLRSAAGESVTLRWDHLTCREGDPETKRTWLAKRSWRNTFLGEKLATIEDADIVARRSGSWASFTRLAEHPFPVDHLVEQFPPERSGRRTKAVSRSFVVARAEPERLILELAPGRYAELPTSLIRPLHDGQLQPGLALDWSRLARGDRLQLERCAAEDTSEELLPNFRVRTLDPDHGRHLAGPLWSVLRRRPDDRVVLGPEKGPGVAADHLAELLRDHVADLGEYPEGRNRYHQLRVLFQRHSSRLVLEGRVGGFRDDPKGRLYFLKIGIDVPIPGRDHWGDPAARTATEPPLTEGTALRIRVMEAEFSGNTLERFLCRIETDSEEVRTSCPVRIVDGRFERCHAPAARGDTVMVYRPADVAGDECRVVGLEDYSVAWDASAEDPLHLNHPEQRRLLFARLLNRPGAVLWATLEYLDTRQQRVRLSRRTQLQRALPQFAEVGRARVVAALSGRRLLVDLLGVPAVLPVGEFCRGVRHQLDLSPCLEKGPIEVEVVIAEGTLVAGAYCPPTGEFEATIEYTLPSGVVARSKGCRFFVEKRELSWCRLEDDLLERLFPHGRTLRLVRLAHRKGQETFSHIRTYDIRSEITELVRSNGPAYVSREYVDEPQRRAIVRGRSGVLMELHLEVEAEVPERFCAFVDHIDESNRRIILSLQEQPIRIWDLPAMPESYAVDRLTTQVIEARLEALRQQLAAMGPEGIWAWAREQKHLEPAPRNLRLVLEQIREVLGADAVWQRPEDLESDATCDFHAVWRELNAVLCGDRTAESIAGQTRFALGYWLVQREDFKTAAEQLDQAARDEALRHDFDVLLTRARAHFLMGRTAKATSFLRELTQGLWASALHTLTVPLIEPEPADPYSDLPGEWNAALKAGRLAPLEQMLRRQAAGEPLSPRSQAQEIWLALARGRLDSLDRLTESYLDALSTEDRRETVDPRHFGLAAYLSFARGDVVGGWNYLDRLASAPRSALTAELATAEFWHTWLSGSGRKDLPQNSTEPLLSALVPVLRQSRWRRVCEEGVFNRLWQDFRISRQRWILSSPRCRALPEPPKEEERLDQWAEDHGVTSALRYLRDDLEQEQESMH